MQSVDDFMHEFILAERQMRRRFAEIEKEMWVRFAVPGLHPMDLVKIEQKYDEFTQVETFHEAGDKATVVATTVRPSQWLTRARYTLCKEDTGWRISCLEWACKTCEATGKIKGIKDDIHECLVCQGKGWFVSPSPKA